MNDNSYCNWDANQHPNFGKVCNHGQLKRKCYTCELEERIVEQEHTIAALVHQIESKDIRREYETDR